MQLYLDSFGAYLSVREGMFQVRVPDQEARRFAVRQVEAILLTKGTAMSTDALLLAAEHDIPVLLIDAQTHYPLAQVHSARPGNIAAVRRAQAEAARSAGGFQWVAAVMADKIARQKALLLRLSDTEGDTLRMMSSIETTLRQWQPPAGEWQHSAAAERLRGQEGTASRLYFQALGQWLQQRGVVFTNRQQRPAYEPFNALLNYLYGILYTQVQLALLKSGLDPTMGILHADQYGGRPTLAYDLIEPYRPWADEVALLHIVPKEGFATGAYFQPDADGAGWWLSAEGKSEAVEKMLLFLAEKSTFEGRMLRKSVQIDLAAQKLAGFLQEIQQ